MGWGEQEASDVGIHYPLPEMFYTSKIGENRAKIDIIDTACGESVLWDAWKCLLEASYKGKGGGTVMTQQPCCWLSHTYRC